MSKLTLPSFVGPDPRSGGYPARYAKVVTFQSFHKREFGYYVLPLLVGDQLVGRAEPRFDRKTKTLEVLGAWGDTSRLHEALESLAIFLGAKDMATGLGQTPARQ